jgi:hypothetical protein
MAQGILSYQYESERNATGMTALAGLPVVLEMWLASGVSATIARSVHTRGRGWSDQALVTSLVMLMVAGGECVEDLRILAKDAGFGSVLRHALMHGLRGHERRALRRRLLAEGARSVPSPSSAFRFLEAMHDPAQEEARERAEVKAFIPRPNEPLRALVRSNAPLLNMRQAMHPERSLTFDLDATLCKTSKESAFFCYQHDRAYQPLNVYCPEYRMMLHSEFRDGNVPAGYQQLRVVQEAVEMVPAGVQRISLRSDSAGYEVELLRYCAEGKSERFGVIDFAVSSDVNKDFKKAVAAVAETEWKPIERDLGDGTRMKTGQDWAEVVFVPNWAGHSKRGPTYRFLAIREPLTPRLPGLDESEPQRELPFQTIELGKAGTFKLFGVVTNRLDTPGDEIIWWLRERCGKAEEAHAILKNDFAGGTLPSALFGANAAWWAICILAFNLLSLFKRALPESKTEPRAKGLRFSLLNIPGRVIRRARQLFIRLAADHPSLALLAEARRRILAWATLVAALPNTS